MYRNRSLASIACDALRLGIGAMYQISALQAAFPQYGLQWILGLTYVLRLQGTRMVAAKEYRQFKGLFLFILAYAARFSSEILA